VKDTKDGQEYTEAKMNGFPEATTGDRFEGDEYRFLIVASKFQTGFDQPKLVSMYVDKKLSGVTCVQTLSRLNRTMAGKKETFVLDFENSAEDIASSFQPFYDRIALSKETDANQLYNIRTDLDKVAIHEPSDLEAFAKGWFAARRNVAKLQGLVNPVAKKWQAESEETAHPIGSQPKWIRLR
jgi:type I restriction enzyme R subunit